MQLTWSFMSFLIYLMTCCDVKELVLPNGRFAFKKHFVALLFKSSKITRKKNISWHLFWFLVLAGAHKLRQMFSSRLVPSVCVWHMKYACVYQNLHLISIFSSNPHANMLQWSHYLSDASNDKQWEKDTNFLFYCYAIEYP